MKKLVTIVAVVCCALGLSLTAVVAADAPKGEIKVTNYGKKDPVMFDHGSKKHASLECVSCHHNEADGNYLCGDCHKLEEGDAPEIKDAFHKKGMGVCYDCHRDRDAEAKMKCGDCHK